MRKFKTLIIRLIQNGPQCFPLDLRIISAYVSLSFIQVEMLITSQKNFISFSIICQQRFITRIRIVSQLHICAFQCQQLYTFIYTFSQLFAILLKRKNTFFLALIFFPPLSFVSSKGKKNSLGDQESVRKIDYILIKMQSTRKYNLL